MSCSQSGVNYWQVNLFILWTMISIAFVPGGSPHLLIFFFFLPFLKIVYIYLYKLAILWSLLDLSSMTRDQTHVPCREAHSPNHLDHEGIPWPHHLKSTQESLWASCTKRKQIYLSYFCIFLMFYNILTSTSAPNSSHCQLSASDLVIS